MTLLSRVSLLFFVQWPCDRGEWSRGVGRCLGHLGSRQDVEGLQERGWDHLETFRYPQALEPGKQGTTWASSRGPGIPGRALHPNREEKWGGDAAGQDDIKSSHLCGCPRAARAPRSLSVFPPELAPPHPTHRDITERDVLDLAMLSPTRPRLVPSSLGEGTAVSVPPRPNLRPST